MTIAIEFQANRIYYRQDASSVEKLAVSHHFGWQNHVQQSDSVSLLFGNSEDQDQDEGRHRQPTSPDPRGVRLEPAGQPRDLWL